MVCKFRCGFVGVATVVLALTGPIGAAPQRPDSSAATLRDFDVRAERPAAAPAAGAAAELLRAASEGRDRQVRLNPYTGSVRLLQAPGMAIRPASAPGAIANILEAIAERLGLERSDLASLELVRDYTSSSTGLRHVVFAQLFDGIPVFDGLVAVHVDSGGEVARVTSSAGRGTGRERGTFVQVDRAAATAAHNIRPDVAFVPDVVEPPSGARRRARIARGPFAADLGASLVWLPIDGTVRLAWMVDVDPGGEPQHYDVLVDAASGDVLLRRNRVRYSNGTGRVIQSAETAALDPRQPDQMPIGSSSCPPPVNHELRDLTVPFRDPGTVLSGTGRLEGNNVAVRRGDPAVPSQVGTFDGTRWTFDFPFNSAGAAETTLFFALNFAHDFFYDLGFDGAAGNFQVNNLDRGGLGGDPVLGVARAAGRNNATFQPEPEGTSPIVSMFLWDGNGCWAQDVDGDGTADLDGDLDFDIVLHEFHHGVSHRLNTAFSGFEADAIGEGGSDFFAYSVNGDTTLAEYSYAGGIRGINEKVYSDWFCFLGFFCEPHANGEIFANVLWDVRERFRLDTVRGSEAAAVNESHQLYVDALKLSPPMPTMLDIRDAMLQADALRNPSSPTSQNFCRVWESFAGRGMGVSASDTSDTGNATVIADYSVPSGCAPIPGPPSVTLAVTQATATEAGTTPGIFTISRSSVSNKALTVQYAIAGPAKNGVDYITLSGSATIPAGEPSADVVITPIDDTVVESNETVTLSVRATSAYTVGSPGSGTVTIVSDDTAPDLVVLAIDAPPVGGAGELMTVAETTKNQGTAVAPPSVTAFYLSVDGALDATDTLLGTRDVGELAPGASSAGTTTFTVPSSTPAGLFFVIAKSDNPGAISEIQEQNNSRWDTVRIGPDLVVSAMTVPAVAGRGAQIAVSDTTRNQGGAAGSASLTRFHLSADRTLDSSDTALGERSVPPLGIGESSAATTTLTIPPDTATGTYFLFAAADDRREVAEGNETNNLRSATIRVGPDLVVSALTVPAIADAGMQITVSDTTRNEGGGGGAASLTRFYFSANATLDSTDPPLGERSVPPLGAGESSVGTTALTIPANTVTGTYYLFASADDRRDVTESNEANNLRSATIRIGPDLLVANLAAPSRAEPGSTIAVSDTTRNGGAGRADGSVTGFYLSANVAWDTGDWRLGSRTVGPLAGNEASTAATSVTLPAVAPGLWYLLARADDGANVAEMNEGNNLRYVVVLIGPDLSVSWVGAPSTAVAGSVISIADTTRNGGIGIAGASVTRFVLSTTSSVNSTVAVLGERAVPALAANATSNGSLSVTLPAGLTGKFYLIAVADAAGSVAEANESNNTWGRVITINP